MYIKTDCPECGTSLFVNIRTKVSMSNTRPITTEMQATDSIHESDLVEKVVRNLEGKEELDIEKTLIMGFNVSPSCISELSEKIKTKLKICKTVNTV